MVETSITKPNAQTYLVEDLVAQVAAGRIRVPSFQRQLRWQWEDVRRLFDSIEKGYPIGSLLLWAHPADAESVHLGALHIDAPKFDDALWVVDGQQRLTSLANALSDAGSRDPRFAVAYDLRTGEFRRPLDGNAFVVPLPVLFDLQRVLRWFSSFPEAMNFLDDAARITKSIRQYSIPAYIVKQEDEAILRDIFDRMNNYGKRLTRAEVFSALHSKQGPSGPPHTFTDIADSIDAERGFGKVDDDTVLRAVLARRGADVTREIRVEFDRTRVQRDFAPESVGDAYLGSEQALLRAITFLQDEAGIPHFTFLPYRFLLVVLTRLFAHHPDPRSRNLDLLRRWVWRAALAGPQLAKGSATAAMRLFANRIVPKRETASVQALLTTIGNAIGGFQLPHRFRTNTAEARFVSCALWSLKPRSMADGSEYDRTQLAETLLGRRTASDAFVTLFSRREPEALTRAGNRLILLSGETADEARTRLAHCPPDLELSTWDNLLESHAMNRELGRLLDQGDSSKFFDARDVAVELETKRFLSAMTQSDFEDTPPLEDLICDDDEDEPDDF